MSTIEIGRRTHRSSFDSFALVDAVVLSFRAFIRLIPLLMPESLEFSAIVAAEIRFGLERLRLPERRAVLVQNLLDVLPVETFDEPVSHAFGTLRFQLQQIGVTVAAMDLLIASHALALKRTFICDDQVFVQVPGLHLVQAS